MVQDTKHAAGQGLVMHLEMQFQHGRNSKVSKQAAAMQGTNYHHVEIEFVAAACGLWREY